jgi:hypothetical protein
MEAEEGTSRRTHAQPLQSVTVQRRAPHTKGAAASS